ncbi:MAG: hypothetical protein ACK4NS_04095 [Saprospiraceae bacterium]
MTKFFLGKGKRVSGENIAGEEPVQSGDMLKPCGVSLSAESTPYDEMLANCSKEEAILIENIRRRILNIKAPQLAIDRLNYRLSQEIEQLSRDK